MRNRPISTGDDVPCTTTLVDWAEDEDVRALARKHSHMLDLLRTSSCELAIYFTAISNTKILPTQKDVHFFD